MQATHTSMRGRNPSPPHAQLRPTSTDRKEQESRQRWGRGQQRPPLSPSLGMDGSKEPVNPLTALPKCLQSCKPTRVPGLMGGMWTWGPGRPHLNSAPFLAPTKQSTITTWRPWSPWDVDPGHRGQSGHLAREQRARPRLQARVASISKEPRWAEGQRSAAVSPGRRWPGNTAENRCEEVVSRGHRAHPDRHRRCLQDNRDGGEWTRAHPGWALGTWWTRRPRRCTLPSPGQDDLSCFRALFGHRDRSCTN